MKRILSVQDISCFGQCSLTVALPIISRYGIEVSILPSAILSTHTGGFKNFTVLDLTDEMPKIINHWKQEHITFDAIYTGYIGDVRQFDFILDCHKSLNKGLLIVDPAMADHGKLYIALNDDIVYGMRKIVSKADIILPNITEASFLLDIPYEENYEEEHVKDLLKQLTAMGAKIAVLTGYTDKDGNIGAYAYDSINNSFHYYVTKKIEKMYHGTGDVFSSFFIGSYLKDSSIDNALKEACEKTYKSIECTIDDKEHNYGVHFEKVLSDN